MDEVSKASPQPSALDSGRWIALVVLAVILAEGIWGLLVSLTNNLVVPFLARTMGGDAQSPFYLGKGDFNVPALFVSLLQRCFAGIVAVILSYWAGRKPKLVRVKSMRVTPVAPQAAAAVPARAAAPTQAASSGPLPAASPPAAPSASPAEFWSPPKPQPRVAPASPLPPPKPAKPKPPKEVYYNIVGEPINPTEDE